jgi:hypothetical protein
MKFFRVLLRVVAASVLLAGCNHAPKRPANVPVSSIWAGGRDGGVFIDCAASRNGGPNTCTVYQETGDIYMQGNFILQGQSRGAGAAELKFNAADGSRIYLENHLVLVPQPKNKSADVAPHHRP